jgi:hypothetical protein
MLKVAQAPVDQLGRGGRCPAGKILHFGEKHAVAAPHCITGDAAAVDAAADHHNVEV